MQCRIAFCKIRLNFIELLYWISTIKLFFLKTILAMQLQYHFKKHLRKVLQDITAVAK